jgi:hypothetical protein
MTTSRRIRAAILTAATLALLASSTGSVTTATVVASADNAVVIDATTSGYWDQFGKHIQRTTAYETGIDGRYNYHSFFVFDLTNVDGIITRATLRLENPTGGFNSLYSPLTITFVDVVTSIDELTTRTDRTDSRVDVWEDLGGLRPDSQVYGEYSATSNDNGQIIAIELTDAAVADLNAARGGPIAIGASITNLTGSDSPQELFASSGSPRRIRQLALTVSSGN